MVLSSGDVFIGCCSFGVSGVMATPSSPEPSGTLLSIVIVG